MYRLVFSTLLAAFAAALFAAADVTDDFRCTRANGDAYSEANARLPYNSSDVEESLPRFCPLLFDNFTGSVAGETALASTNLDLVVQSSSCKNDTCVGYLIDMAKILPACIDDDIYSKGDYLLNLAICAHVRSTGSIDTDVINSLFSDVGNPYKIQSVLDDALTKLSGNIRTYAPTAVYRPVPLTPSPPSTKKYTPKPTTATPTPTVSSSGSGGSAIGVNGTKPALGSGSGDSTPQTTAPPAPPVTQRAAPSPAPTSASEAWLVSSSVAFSVALVSAAL